MWPLIKHGVENRYWAKLKTCTLEAKKIRRFSFSTCWKRGEPLRGFRQSEPSAYLPSERAVIGVTEIVNANGHFGQRGCPLEHGINRKSQVNSRSKGIKGNRRPIQRKITQPFVRKEFLQQIVVSTRVDRARHSLERFDHVLARARKLIDIKQKPTPIRPPINILPEQSQMKRAPECPA
jgi:hypothetical protein